MKIIQHIKTILLLLLTFVLGVQPTHAKTEVITPTYQKSFVQTATTQPSTLKKVVQPNVGFLSRKLSGNAKFVVLEGVSARKPHVFSEGVVGVLANGGGIFKAGDNIAGKIVVQVKAGTNGKIAVIGRKMPGHVDDVTAELASQGKLVEAFNDVYQSGKSFDIDGIIYTWDDIVNDFNSLKQQYGVIPDNVLQNSLMYKANQNWAQKLIDEGYEVIDIGYPQGITSESIFYNMELQTIFP